MGYVDLKLLRTHKLVLHIKRDVSLICMISVFKLGEFQKLVAVRVQLYLNGMNKCIMSCRYLMIR
jgi:hypothetical protein